MDEYDQLYATIGWHPTEAGTYTEEIEAYLLDKLKHPKVVALGEIGFGLPLDDSVQRGAGAGFSPSDSAV